MILIKKWFFFIIGKNKSKLTSGLASASSDSSKQPMNGPSKNAIQDAITFDESNHVSYSFNFFLHGASRVCTSVDIKMHKPIRLINKFDLIHLRNNMRRFFQFKTTYDTKRMSNRIDGSDFARDGSKKRARSRAYRKRFKKCFKGKNVLLTYSCEVTLEILGFFSQWNLKMKLHK